MKCVRRIVVMSFAPALFGAAFAGVIGTDDRRAPGDDEVLLVRALGHVVCGRVVDGVRRRSAGTGTIVGSASTILTASHIFTDDAGRRGSAVRFDPVRDCTFRQYDDSGEVTDEVAFIRADLGEDYGNPGAPDDDWAVLKTVRPISGGPVALPFANGSGLSAELAGMRVSILAYHADVRAARRVPLLSEGELKVVNYGGDRRLAHTADMGRMSSGAAIVHRVDDGTFVVVGVNRSSANLGDFNLAVPLTPQLEATLRSHAFGQVPDARQRFASLSAIPVGPRFTR